uniref:WSC domain-containing protein n=1 Tax=Macrostomum lignano TaxID=282301 RepID=A0A1I8IU21_9PLAT
IPPEDPAHISFIADQHQLNELLRWLSHPRPSVHQQRGLTAANWPFSGGGDGRLCGQRAAPLGAPKFWQSSVAREFSNDGSSAFNKLALVETRPTAQAVQDKLRVSRGVRCEELPARGVLGIELWNWTPTPGHGLLHLVMDSYTWSWTPTPGHGLLHLVMGHGLLHLVMDSYTYHGLLHLVIDSYTWSWTPTPGHGLLHLVMDSYTWSWTPTLGHGLLHLDTWSWTPTPGHGLLHLVMDSYTWSWTPTPGHGLLHLVMDSYTWSWTPTPGHGLLHLVMDSYTWSWTPTPGHGLLYLVMNSYTWSWTPTPGHGLLHLIMDSYTWSWTPTHQVMDSYTSRLTALIAAVVAALLVSGSLCQRRATPVYVGCFVDRASPNRDLLGLVGIAQIGPFSKNPGVLRRADMTVELCSEICAYGGFRYFGVQHYRACHCDSSYGSWGPAPESECSQHCLGNPAQVCGGGWRNSIYENAYSMDLRNVRFRKFAASAAPKLVTTAGFAGSLGWDVRMQSLSDCAVFCIQSASCSSFRFNSSSGLCRLSIFATAFVNDTGDVLRFSLWHVWNKCASSTGSDPVSDFVPAASMRRSAQWSTLRHLTIILLLAGSLLYWWNSYPSELLTAGDSGEAFAPSSGQESQVLQKHQSKIDLDTSAAAVGPEQSLNQIKQAVAAKALSESNQKAIKTFSAHQNSTTIKAVLNQSQETAQPAPGTEATLQVQTLHTTDKSSINNVTNNSWINNLCRKGGVKSGAVFLVMSALSREAEAQRAAILSTWGAELQHQRRLVFYAPILPSDAAQESVQSDLLTIRSPAGENRILAGLVWLRSRCPMARAIVLACDRSFWSLSRLNTFLNSRRFDATLKSVYGWWPKPATQSLLAAQPGFIFTGPAVDALKLAAAQLVKDAAFAGQIPVTKPLTELAGVGTVQLSSELVQASSDRPFRIATLACGFKNGRLMSVNGLGAGRKMKLWRIFHFPGLKRSGQKMAAAPKMSECLLRPNSFASYGSLNNLQEEAEAAANDSEALAAPAAAPGFAIADEKMRRRLKYFFMTPCEKYQAKGRLPWKLLLQLAKVVFVTAQLYVFGIETSSQVAFMDSTRAAFRRLYLQGWDAGWESPIATHGPFAVYTYDTMYAVLDTALRGYNQTQSALGSFDLPNATANGQQPEPQFCVSYYRNLSVDAANFQFQLDNRATKRCFSMRPIQLENGTLAYNSKQLLQENNFTLNFDNVLMASLQFNINAIHFNFDAPRLTNAECFQFSVSIRFDNQAHAGQVLVGLTANPSTKACNAQSRQESIKSMGYSSVKEALYTVLDSSVMLVCALSFLSCGRSLYRGFKMRVRTLEYFLQTEDYRLSLDEQFEFVNLWFVLIMLNDLLTVVGSIQKILIEYKVGNNDNYITCGLFLGGGAMLVWLGTLRYLNYFAKYNVLLLTIKRSLPDIIRFLVCAVVLFLSFSLFGWITFGPYHAKFRGFFITLECLFALVNGDDIFNTFAMLPQDTTNTYIYVVSRIYLYSFISLFIYIVLNVCISIIIEAYETVTHRSGLTQPSRLWQFIAECADPASSVAYRHDAAERAAAAAGPSAG